MKLSHLTIAISVALGLAACGGSSNNVDNSTTTTGGGSGGAGGTGGSGGTTTTTPPPPEDGPDIVKEAGREAPGFKPQERFVPEIKSAKAVYSGRNDRQPIGGYEDSANLNKKLPKDAYEIVASPLGSKADAVVETHYVAGTTKVPDALRSGAIYNYVDKGHVVGTGLFNQGEGIASNNPGAVIADPGFTYAQGKDKRYYRMKPDGVNWNAVSATTDYVPVNSAYVSQFAGGSVGQDELVFIPNARLASTTLESDSGVADLHKTYQYTATGIASIDNAGKDGGVDGISIGGDNDTYTYLLGSGGTINGADVTLVAEPILALANTHVDRRGTAIANTYFNVATGKDPATGDVVFKTIPAYAAAAGLTRYELGALVGLQKNAKTLPDNYITDPVEYTIKQGETFIDDAGNDVQAAQDIVVKQFKDMHGNVLYTQALNTAGNAPGTKLVAYPGKAGPDRLLKYENISTVAFDVIAGGNLSNGKTKTDDVLADDLTDIVTKFKPSTSGNGFDVNRGVVEWNYLTLLGKQYDLASNVTSKANELDFSSLKVANEIQDVPLTATYTVAGNKGTTSPGDDKDEQFTVDAGMLKVYNLPYHRSFVNINQDAVDNTGDRGFYDSFQLAGNGIGNGRYGALQVAGYETPSIPWNGRAKYNGKSYGIYTDGQYVSGDIILNADFGKDRPGVSGSVHNRVLADGKSVPDMELQRIQLLVNSKGTNNFDTGTAAMSASNKTGSGQVLIGGIQNAGTWDFQLYGPDAEEIGGLIQYGNTAPVTGQKQPMGAFNKGSNGKSQGYNEVFSAQRVGFSETSNQSQIPVK